MLRIIQFLLYILNKLICQFLKTQHKKITKYIYYVIDMTFVKDILAHETQSNVGLYTCKKNKISPNN